MRGNFTKVQLIKFVKGEAHNYDDDQFEDEEVIRTPVKEKVQEQKKVIRRPNDHQRKARKDPDSEF